MLAAGDADPVPTVRDLFARWWNEHGRLLAGVTIRAHLNTWETELGESSPATVITSDRLASIIGRWRGQPGNSDPTINRRLATLRAAHNRAIKAWQWKLKPVAWTIIWLEETPIRDRSLDMETRARLIEAWPQRSRSLVAMAAVTGLRRGALLTLTREQLDFAGGVIRAIGKGRAGGKENLHPMHAGVMAVLAMHGRLPDVGRLWPLTNSQLSKDLEVARTAIGRPDVGIHSLRHSFAQDLEDEGEGEAITSLLHHSDPGLRWRYSHTRMERARQVIERALGTRNGPRRK